MSVLIIVLVISILCLVILFVRNESPVRDLFLWVQYHLCHLCHLMFRYHQILEPTAPSFSLDEYIGPTYNYAKKLKLLKN